MERLTPTWRKSSYSGNGGINCVEVATLPWRKSTHSADGNNCVELGTTSGAVLIRDTKTNGTGPVLRVTPTAWHRFTTSLKR
jgi:hypothetical protein